jgi:hypothetical protein
MLLWAGLHGLVRDRFALLHQRQVRNKRRRHVRRHRWGLWRCRRRGRQRRVVHGLSEGPDPAITVGTVRHRRCCVFSAESDGDPGHTKCSAGPHGSPAAARRRTSCLARRHRMQRQFGNSGRRGRGCRDTRRSDRRVRVHRRGWVLRLRRCHVLGCCKRGLRARWLLERRRSKAGRAEKDFTEPGLADSDLRPFQAHWNGRPN